MKVVRATSTDGRVFSREGDSFKVTSTPTPKTAALQDRAALPIERLLRPQAAYRWMLPQLAAITPQYIEMVLRSALTGNHVQQWELFDLMLDTWPELAACTQELSYGVSRLKMIYEPFAEEDEDPTPSAVERCKLVSSAMRRMAPDAASDDSDITGTVTDIVDGWFRGVTCLEVMWHTVKAGAHGTIQAPRSTAWVHPVCFAFDQDGRLGLRTDGRGQLSPGNVGGMATQGPVSNVSPFPPHKFLIGIHKAKSGSALGGALLRPLAWWWCAANFSSDWLLNLAELFGIPFRLAKFDPTAADETVSRICQMLQSMGARGWGAFPTGTEVEFMEAGKSGSDHSPQGELLDRADRYARLLILGQTMSGSQDASKGGGKAFGEVEGDVKAQRVDAAGRYACRVINTQLIPSILELNYGNTDEAPTVRLLEDEEGGLQEAQRDLILSKLFKLSGGFLRKKYGQPAPQDEEDEVGGTPDPEPVSTGKPEKPDPLKAANANHDELGRFASGGTSHVAIEDEHWTGTRHELRARATAIMKGFTPAVHPTLGPVRFSRDGIGKTLKIQQTAHEFQSVQALPELVRKGHLAKTEADNRNRPEVHGYHTLQAALTIGATTYRAEMVIKQSTDGVHDVQKFYLHRLRHESGPVKTKATGPIADPAFQPDRGPGGEGNLPPPEAEVNARLLALGGIADDALFTRALHALLAGDDDEAICGREYARDNAGRFTPVPYSETEATQIIASARTMPGKEIMDDEAYAENLAEATDAAVWRAQEEIAEARMSRLRAGSQATPADEASHQKTLVAISRLRERETHALTALAALAARKRTSAAKIPDHEIY
jgi:phage gp29-like protein